MLEGFEEQFEIILNEANKRCKVIVNEDAERIVLPVLKGLRKNQNMFGFPLCPCRPRYITLESPEDFSCPCKNLEDDIAEKGHCTCKLFIKAD